jgi:DNA-binding MarR family transcriptional regulator
MDRFRGKKRQGKLLRYRPEVTRRSRPTASHLGALRIGGPRRLLELGGELGVIARNVTGLVDALQRDGPVERLPTPPTGGPPWARLTPPGDRVAGALLAEQRAALAERLAELPEADQRHLVQALEPLRAVLARHPDLPRRPTGTAKKRAASSSGTPPRTAARPFAKRPRMRSRPISATRPTPILATRPTRHWSVCSVCATSFRPSGTASPPPQPARW